METGNFKFFIFEGPGEMKGVVEEVKKKVLKINPGPELTDPMTPVLLWGQSPFKDNLMASHLDIDYETLMNTKSLSEVVQIARTHARLAITLSGDAMNAASFKEVKPMLMVSKGVGPTTTIAICDYYQEILHKKQLKIHANMKPLDEPYIKSCRLFAESETRRWEELGFYSIITPSAETDKKTKIMLDSISGQKTKMGYIAPDQTTAVKHCTKLVLGEWRLMCKKWIKSRPEVKTVNKSQRPTSQNS